MKTVSLSFDGAQTRDRDVARLQCTKDIQKLKEEKENKVNFSTLDRSPKSEKRWYTNEKAKSDDGEEILFNAANERRRGGREKNMNKRRSRNVVVAAFLRECEKPHPTLPITRAGALTNESVKSSS